MVPVEAAARVALLVMVRVAPLWYGWHWWRMHTCIASGTQDDINEVLAEPGCAAVLCQNAEFELTAPVVF